MAQTEWWRLVDAKTAVTFQLATTELCMPFSEFHRLLESALGRPVFTHEIALSHNNILKELNGEKPPPSITDIIGLLPKDKTIVIVG